MHPSDLRMDPAAAQAVLQQFVALGYIQPPSEDQSKAVDVAVREQQYNLACMYLDSRRPHEALPILEELWKKWPDQARFAQYLAQCYLALRKRDEAKAILQNLINNPPKPAPRKKAEESPDQAQVAIEVQEANAEAAPAEAKAMPRPWADLLMGIINFEEGDMDAALTSLLKAESADPRLPDLHLRIGEVYLRQRRSDDAERAFQKALDIDGDSPAAHLGLAMVHLRKRRNEQAAEQALQAVGLQHFLPMGHFYLGVALRVWDIASALLWLSKHH